MLEAGRDEVLGEGMADAVVELIKGKAEGEVKLVTVDGALHSEAVGRGQSDVVKWVEGVVSEREKNMEKVGE